MFTERVTALNGASHPFSVAGKEREGVARPLLSNTSYSLDFV